MAVSGAEKDIAEMIVDGRRAFHMILSREPFQAIPRQSLKEVNAVIVATDDDARGGSSQRRRRIHAIGERVSPQDWMSWQSWRLVRSIFIQLRFFVDFQIAVIKGKQHGNEIFRMGADEYDAVRGWQG